MPEGPFAREALVAVGDDPREVVVLDGSGDGAMTVQEGLLAVEAGSGPVGGSLVDGGNDEAYLHECGASLW